LLQRSESLPSNSDSQANEREYVLNILGENDYTKPFLNDCLRSPVCRNQNNSEADTSVKGYAIVPYIQGVTEQIKRILSNCNIKVALKPYLTLGHIFAKPKVPVKQITKSMLYILYHAVTARKNIFILFLNLYKSRYLLKIVCFCYTGLYDKCLKSLFFSFLFSSSSRNGVCVSSSQAQGATIKPKCHRFPSVP
jgi:hypothetical protein